MDQVTELPSQAELLPSLLQQKLDRVVPQVEDAIGAAGIQIDDPLTSGLGKNDVVNRLPKSQTGFEFWGSLEKSFSFFPSGNPTAIIKYFEVPEKGKGAGSLILGAWEKGMMVEGITNFAATNIRDEHAMGFWQNQGYQPQGAMRSGIPYCMVKTVTSQA